MANNAESTQYILPLLDQQIDLAGTLESLLQAEYQALLGSDIARLAELVSEKRRAAESLERSSLALSQQTGGVPAAAMPYLGHEAQMRWQQLGVVAERLRSQNLHNGALLNERQNRLRWVSQRASGDTPALYSPHASPGFASTLSGRSLARA